MKYIASLALLATVLFSSSATASLDLCTTNDKFFEYDDYSISCLNNSCAANNEICIDIEGRYKADLPLDGSNVAWHVKKDKSKDWSVGIYSALKLVNGASLPITINWASTTRVCTFLPPEFQDLKNTDIEFKVKITRPGNKNPDAVICLAGTLRLNEKI